MNISLGPILVIDDVPNVRELLEVTLRFKGYPVISASNGQEAMTLLERERPALIIADILMPKMDGFTFAHNLRLNPKTRYIPLIFLSATYVTPEDKRFALNLGAAHFLEKPIDTEEFLLTVAEILTQGSPSLSAPMNERDFYQGYHERLEQKLRHKNTQIARTERLLLTLPPNQKPAFEALLQESVNDRNEIQQEFDQLTKIIEQMKSVDHTGAANKPEQPQP